MDAAAAAAMSDPDRNPHFRRRWDEAAPGVAAVSASASARSIGTFGMALLEALRRAAPDCAVHLRQQPEGHTDG